MEIKQKKGHAFELYYMDIGILGKIYWLNGLRMTKSMPKLWLCEWGLLLFIYPKDVVHIFLYYIV